MFNVLVTKISFPFLPGVGSQLQTLSPSAPLLCRTMPWCSMWTLSVATLLSPLPPSNPGTSPSLRLASPASNWLHCKVSFLTPPPPPHLLPHLPSPYLLSFAMIISPLSSLVGGRSAEVSPTKTHQSGVLAPPISGRPLLHPPALPWHPPHTSGTSAVL